MRIILASQSPFRKKQLSSLGVEFAAVSPNVDEESLKDLSLPPAHLAEYLAKAKCLSVAHTHPNDFVIGGDQLLHFSGEILGKAGNKEMAIEQLLKLQGQTHELITAMVVSCAGEVFSHVELAKMKMKNLSRQELTDYVEKDQSWDCAGSYKFELSGKTLFESWAVDDVSSIIGLPMSKLREWLKKYQLFCEN